MILAEIAQKISYKEFISSFKKTIKSAFYEVDNIEKFVQKRGFPEPVLNKIMSSNPLSVAIPEEYGGRGIKPKECLGILDAASYESLPLSLTLGINIGLFLQPVAKYAQPSIKEDLYNRFLNNQNMGGLMITEPDYGSDALNMQTSNEKIGSKYHIKGTKHWQGLTGMADYWLMTTRPKMSNGELGRDLEFFISDNQNPDQRIIVDEYYNNIGLYPIPYGKNIVDIKVPEQYKLQAETTGLKLMMDLLHRSRLQFPGMGNGFIRRMLDEALKHCTERFVSGKALIEYDQVKAHIAKLQSAFTITSALCKRSSVISSIQNNLALIGVEANSMKAYVTDLMQESAQILTQLKGANGYKEESVSSRGIVDSRPFQIFEGSNDMLYSQISEMVLKAMAKTQTSNLFTYLKNYELTEKVADYFKSTIDFNLDNKMPQRKIVDLGKIISKVVSANHVLEIGNDGFRLDLVSNSLETIKHEISTLVSSFKFQTQVMPIQDYKDNSSWLAFS